MWIHAALHTANPQPQSRSPTVGNTFVIPSSATSRPLYRTDIDAHFFIMIDVFKRKTKPGVLVRPGHQRIRRTPTIWGCSSPAKNCTKRRPSEEWLVHRQNDPTSGLDLSNESRRVLKSCRLKVIISRKAPPITLGQHPATIL